MPLRHNHVRMLYRMLALFTLFAIGIGAAGYLHYRTQKQNIKKNVQDELAAIADLKVEQLTAWRNERLGNASVISQNTFIASAVRDYFNNPGSKALRQELFDWMQSRAVTYNYKSVLLVDAGGTVRISTLPEDNSISPAERKIVREAVRTRKPVLSDITASPPPLAIHMDLVAPLMPRGQRSGVPIAAVIFRIDPHTSLYPLIKLWPGQSASAETLLIRREGNEVLYLNDLRHRANTALTYRIALNENKDQGLKDARSGKKVSIETVDYRGIPVLTTPREVPGTPWFLITKMDTAEMYAPLRGQAVESLFMIIILIGAASLVIFFWWRKKSAEEAHKRFEAELANKLLTQRYDYLSKYANDIILLVHPDGMILEANDRAVASYGYSRVELLRKSLRDIRSPETWQDLPRHMQQAQMDGGSLFSTVHKRKDDSTFPVEVSSRMIDLNGKRLYLSVIRDITERRQSEIALINEKNRSEEIISAIDNGISIVDRNFRVLYQNRILKDLVGDGVGKFCHEVFQRFGDSCDGCVVAATYRDGTVHFAERCILTTRGKTNVEITASPLRDESGAIVAGIEIIRDVTARKEIEHALVRERDRAQQYLDIMNSILVAVDVDQRIVLLNKKGCASLGYDEQELIGRNWFDTVIPAALRDTMKSIFSQILSGKTDYAEYYENPIITKSGEQRTIAWHNSVVKDDAGTIIGTLSSGDDITERKQAERSLLESEQRYKRLVKSVTDYIFTSTVVNGRAVSTFHGPGCLTVTGYASQEYEDDPNLWYNMIFDSDRNDVIEKTNAILAGAAAAPFEHRIIHKDGSLRWVRHTPVPRYDANGHVISYDGLITDITQLKHLENQLRQAQKMEAIGQLAGGIAHDFNNILTAIIGYSHLLLMKMDERDSGHPFVEQIIAASERAAHLTRSILAFSRKQIIDLKPVELNSIVRRLEHLLGRIIGEDITFSTMLSDDDLTVMADSVQIEQILMNLATNARDAMPSGGILRIETSKVELGEAFIRTYSYGTCGTYACLSVIDTGEGMDEQTKGKIFEPFFTTKDVGKGTGLGLSMVYGIIKQHNGYINVYSEPGKGSIFKIFLPLISASAIEKPVSRDTGIERGTETVILAEDDKTVRELTRHVLEDAGYTVIEAADGEEAVQKFLENRERISILIFDIMMPKKNGKEAYQDINKIRPNIKVLFLSGYTANMVYDKGILKADLDMVLKPISPSVFLRKVREILDRK